MDCLACHLENADGARFCAKCGAPLPIPFVEEDPLIGRNVGGRYLITGILGEGGMGRVYAGEQKMGTSVRKAAIKTLLSQFAKDPQTVGRFMREVGTISELEHPNTIKVYDFGQVEETGELYIAMELLQGTALDDALASGQPLAPERVDRIVGQVCGSLQEAHDKGIVHRDLKPANIFLTTRAGEEDVVKVLDFGIAKRGNKESKSEQKLTQQGTILGTPPYMSPEQFTGKELDRRSDLYSLGVVTYEMLTGRLPFEAETPWQWMNQHANVQPLPFEATPAAANVPLKMRQAVMRALAKDPKDRPQSARELFEDLTLGAMRMSALGLGSGGIGGIRGASMVPSVSSARSSSDPGPARPGATQIGEPLVQDAGFYPGSTAPYSGAQPYASGTAPGIDPHVAFGHPAVPTAGGQAFPAPPQRPAKSGGSGLAIVLGLLAIGGAAGGFVYWRSLQVEPTTAETSETTAEDDDPAPANTAPTAAPVPSSAAVPTDTVAPSPTDSAPVVATLPGHSALPTEQEWTAQPDVTVLEGAKLGCTAKNVREWVRVLCKDTNASGGTPTSLSIDQGGGKGDTFTEVKNNTTALIYPFQEGTDIGATFNWTDKASNFKSAWPKGLPRPPAVGAFAPNAPPPIAHNNPRPQQPLPIPIPSVTHRPPDPPPAVTVPTSVPTIRPPTRDPVIRRPKRPDSDVPVARPTSTIKRPRVRPGEIKAPRNERRR